MEEALWTAVLAFSAYAALACTPMAWLKAAGGLLIVGTVLATGWQLLGLL